MKRRYFLRTALLTVLLSVTGAQAADSARDYLKAFPPAEKGMERRVLLLPPKEDESRYRLELIVGKTVPTDPVNRHFYTGKIEAQKVKGWGFTRYVVRDLGSMASTVMAVPPDTPKVECFIPLGAQPILIRYNSKVPVVLYIPEGAEARYRIWSAPKETQPFPTEP